MTVFEIEAGGKRYQVDAPDQESAVKALRKLQSGQSGAAGGVSPANAAEPDNALGNQRIRGAFGEDTGPLGSVVQGMTFGFGDEIAGAFGGAMDWMGFGPDGADGTFEGGYDRTVAKARNTVDSYGKENPITATGLEVGGALSTIPVTGPLNLMRGAGIVPKVVNSAATGGAYGAAYGAGTADGGIPERLEGATEGGVLGATVGAVAPPVIEGLKAGAKAVGRVANPWRNMAQPQARAERAVGEAVRKDAHVQGDTAARYGDDIAAAQRAGEPVTPLDAGAATRDLGRQAVNLSEEGRAVLHQSLDNRYATQYDRIADVIERNAPGVNAPETRKLLEAAARKSNEPAYKRAYARGMAGVWNPELEQLTVSPAVQSAMRDAIQRSANEAAKRGQQPPRAPFRFNDDGTMTPVEGVRPTLEYWDQVQRSLRDMAEGQKGNRAKEMSSQLEGLRRRLNEVLDTAVPEFRQARLGAFEFFGAENALDAGAAFVRRSGDNAAAREAIQKMTPAERQLFGEGFATQLLEDLRNVRDRNTLVTKVFESPAARERLRVALGDRAAQEMETRLALEATYDLGRRAIQGGATDRARDIMSALTQIGVGAGAGAYVSGGDITNPTALVTAALVLGGMRGGRALVSKATQKGNEAVARSIADMLASNDPATIQRAVERISRSERLSGALVRGYTKLSRALVPVVSGNEGRAVPAQIAGGSQPAHADGEGQ